MSNNNDNANGKDVDVGKDEYDAPSMKILAISHE